MYLLSGYCLNSNTIHLFTVNQWEPEDINEDKNCETDDHCRHKLTYVCNVLPYFVLVAQY